MNQKTKKVNILILIVVLTSFHCSFQNKIFQFEDIADNIDKENIYIIMSSSGWDPEILKVIEGFPPECVDLFVGDANNDGLNDIVTANFNSNDFSILLWNADIENWSSTIRKSLGGHARSITIGDANNDGDNDIIVGWYSGTNPRISIYCWNYLIQDWNSQITKSISAEPGNTYVGDVNNDGYYDIITGGYGSGVFSYFLWNNTINDWNPHAMQSLADWSEDIFVGDADNDGFNDVVATLHDTDDINILIWNDTLNNWNPGITRSVGDAPNHIYIEDVNNDGENDITVSNSNSNDISILIWNSSISNWNGEIRKTTGISPWGLFVNDANNDGYNDIVIANMDDNDISLYIWNSTLNNWNAELQLGISHGPIELIIEDVNNDGLNDIASVGLSSFISILLSNIDAPFLNPIIPSFDTNGIVKLNWSSVKGISHYYIYRNTSFINSIDGLNPIAITSDNNYTDILSLNGDYYYVIIANDGFGNSSISNCRNVGVRIPLDTPTLIPITPDPDYDGSINLDWDDIDKVTSYAIYRDTSFITSTSLLSPINFTSNNFYTDSINTNGIYYYGIVATDGFVYSNLSNCENVTVLIPLTQPTLDPILPNPDYDGLITLNWQAINAAIIYYVFRNISFINSVNQLRPINSTANTFYSETLDIDETYYYVIVAGDGFVNSSISNCVNVTIDFTLNKPNISLTSLNPSLDGNVLLEWDKIEGATEYYVYRDFFYISSVNPLDPITITTNLYYSEKFYENNIYFYAIIASNGIINSPISNCIEVTIGRPLDTPNLFHINNYGDGTVELFWDEVENATRYYIFRDNVSITSVNHLRPIAIVPSSAQSYIDGLYQIREFFYVIMATDLIVNSSISNCMSVYVEYSEEPTTPGILGYDIFVIFLMISIISLVVFNRKYKILT